MSSRIRKNKKTSAKAKARAGEEKEEEEIPQQDNADNCDEEEQINAEGVQENPQDSGQPNTPGRDTTQNNPNSNGLSGQRSPTAAPIVLGTVQNVQTLLFHEEKEKYFMDDKHVEEGHPSYTVLTRKHVDDLEQQFKAFKTTWPAVSIVTQQYFSAKAQDRIEDYMMLKDIDKDIWVQPWEQLIEVLKLMFPETVIEKKRCYGKSQSGNY